MCVGGVAHSEASAWLDQQQALTEQKYPYDLACFLTTSSRYLHTHAHVFSLKQAYAPNPEVSATLPNALKIATFNLNSVYGRERDLAIFFKQHHLSILAC